MTKYTTGYILDSLYKKELSLLENSRGCPIPGEERQELAHSSGRRLENWVQSLVDNDTETP